MFTFILFAFRRHYGEFEKKNIEPSDEPFLLPPPSQIDNEQRQNE